MDPTFSAASSSAKQLWQLLRCVGFNSKAQVLITKEGIRFTVEESQVMQGVVFLDRALFATYAFNAPDRDESGVNEDERALGIPPFEISLSSLLETLQLFGINDSSNKDRWSSRNGMQSSVLGIDGMCRVSYQAIGDPLCIILEETGVTTAGELTTYEPSFFEEIPLQKDGIVQKIIMRASWLHDAVLELSSTSPRRLTIASSPQAPFFTLSSIGALGSASVEFSKDPQLLETFQVSRRTINTYKYSLIKSASRAMSVASKVSIRTDVQGVLSLQFMIETELEGKGNGFAFVDFRFVPYIDCDGDEDNGSQGDDAMDQDY